MTADLLVELGTEELPPKALITLRDAFAAEFVQQLDDAGFSHGEVDTFASPRRLAFRVNSLATQQPDRELEKRGPAVKSAFDADGQPSRAAQGFAQSVGLSVDQLERMQTDKGEWLFARATQKGQSLDELVQGFLEQAINKLPIPKRMHWGSRRALFVRPVHWLVVLLDERVLPVELLDQKSDSQSYGHRFHHPDAISLTHANQYEAQLEQAHVLANLEQRRELIAQQARQLGEEAGGHTRLLPELLDEVTALVEWPAPLLAHFEERFLRVPQEALISTMEGDQKYFPVLDANDKLTNAFVFVSNISSRDPAQVIAGNEKVVRPRLADAEFFYDVDSKKTLAQHAEPLARVTFQQQLGSVADKCQRLAQLAATISEQLGGDKALAEQAGRLAKADLTSGMVGEFDKLQGIMGRYLALNEGLPEELAQSLEEQYLPRFSGDRLPTSTTGQALALADRLDTLTGIFGIGEKPSGDKDPFALRRAALGVLRILIECQLPLDLKALVNQAAELHGDNITAAKGQEALDFLYGRYRAHYQEQGFSTQLIQAAAAVKPELPFDLDQRLHALASFQQQPSCAALAAANKRVANILAKESATLDAAIDKQLLQETAEKSLAEAIASQEGAAQASSEADYLARLEQLAQLRQPVDRFFDEVMVNVEDTALRGNRLQLLANLRNLFLNIADISLLD